VAKPVPNFTRLDSGRPECWQTLALAYGGTQGYRREGGRKAQRAFYRLEAISAIAALRVGCPVSQGSQQPAGVAIERRRNYLARRHTDSAFVPVEVVGFVYPSSSPVSEVMMRFCSPPMRFGYELPSMRVVSVLSASLTVYVP
jgi:hypothetical protein